MKRPIADEGSNCPIYRRDVSEVCHKCAWYSRIQGTDPQTGREIDDWGCPISFLGPLMINIAQQARQGAAATESFRNEMVERSSLEKELQRVSDAVARLQYTGVAPTTKLISED